jgi:DNA-binding winged helix-turn-helix (wHTH) protein/tetratricopeptide (TPR) repeat protein
MNLSLPPVSVYVFGPFRLNARDHILEREGVRVVLTPKVVDTLLVLVVNADRMVTKEELMKAVWPDVTVVESGLTRNISILRKALEEGMPDGSYIETIPRRGYRFVAPVTEERAEEPAEQEAEPARRRRWWPVWAVAAALVVASLGAVLWFRAGRSNAPRAVEPGIRIGEYLLYQWAPEQSVRATEQFEQEISVNPNSAAAHAGLSIALLQMAALGLRPLPVVAARADAEAKRALELDPKLHSAHYADALSKLHNWQLEESERSFARALELEPASVHTRLGYTHVKFAKKELGEAMRLLEEAIRLDPVSPLLGARYCQAFYYARDFHRAEAECRKVLDRQPHYAMARYHLALSLGWLGRIEEARKSLDGINVGPGVVEADVAWLRLREGDKRTAMQVLERRRESIRQGKMRASTKILLCAILGEKDEAFEAMNEAIAARAFEALTFNVDPRLDPLRTDARYRGVIWQIGAKP